MKPNRQAPPAKPQAVGFRFALHQPTETRHGACFIGFRILPDRIRVRNDNLRRARRRIKQLQAQYREGEIDLEPLVQRLQSWEAHLKHGDTWRLRRKVFDHHVFKRGEPPSD